MFCTRCGVELREKDLYCSQCAHPTEAAGPRPSVPPRLTRDIEHKKVAGVCAGFARYMDVDVVLVRVVWLAVALCTGLGFIAYLVAWIIMPKDSPVALVPSGEYAHHGVNS